MRKTLSRSLLLALTATVLFAQAPASAPKPEFEVASIKPAPPLEPQKIMSGQVHVGMSVDAARVDIGSLSLADLIRIAYRMKPYQVSGPDWIGAQRFNVLAKMPEGASKDNVPEMLQALLADRFKLTSHRESKERPAYALIVGKNGPKLKEVLTEALTEVPKTATPERSPPPPPGDGAAPPGRRAMVLGSGDSQVRVEPNRDGKGATVASPQFGQMKVSVGEAGMMRMEFAKMSMTMLADMLSRFTDKPVLDMTELKGNYQVTLDLSMEDMRTIAMAQAASAGIMLPIGPRGGGGGGEAGRGPAEAASTPGGSSVFNAIQQLGLKLDQRKLPIETLVIDHLEKTPTEN